MLDSGSHSAQVLLVRRCSILAARSWVVGAAVLGASWREGGENIYEDK